MPVSNKEKQQQHLHPPIQMKEFNTCSFSSSSDDDDDDIEYNRKTEMVKQKPSCSSNNMREVIIPDLIPMQYFNLTGPDLVFSLVMFFFVVLELVLDIVLIGWHGSTGHQWASGLNVLFLACGGIALLSQFWGIDRDQQKRIFQHDTCVRASVNSFPWVFTVITSYQAASTCVKSYYNNNNNPALLNKHVKLQELTRSLLKIQTLAQAAPLSVMQLVVLLEDLEEISVLKATTTVSSIVVNLTLMMIANLPLKSDTVGEQHVPRAAYSPYSRMFVGLRMICNFASRTMSLSLYLASFRCSVFRLISTSTSPVLPHLIPLSVLLVPRLLFSIVHYLRYRSSFVDVFLMYVASIFLPFGDVLWLYVYSTLETIVFIVFGFLFAEILGGVGCIGMGVEGIVYFGAFILFFGGVPCIMPWITGKLCRS